MSSPALALALSVDPAAICFPYCSPDGPGTPFANPAFTVLDSARVLLVALTTIAVICTPRIMLASRTWGQAVRWIPQATWGIVAANTELEHLGDVGSPRLALNLLATVAYCVGVYSFYFRERGTTGSIAARSSP